MYIYLFMHNIFLREQHSAEICCPSWAPGQQRSAGERPPEQARGPLANGPPSDIGGEEEEEQRTGQGRVCSAEFACLHVTVITDLPNSNISKIYYIMMIWAFFFFHMEENGSFRTDAGKKQKCSGLWWNVKHFYVNISTQ